MHDGIPLKRLFTEFPLRALFLIHTHKIAYSRTLPAYGQYHLPAGRLAPSYPLEHKRLVGNARLMRGSFRFHDRLYRFGGEEFVVLMRSAGDEGALNAFERMRRRVEAHAFPQVGQITVSIGLTEIKPGDSPSGGATAPARASPASLWLRAEAK